MATYDALRPASGEVPTDLLPVLRASGVLSERFFEEIKGKVRAGDYPFDPVELAQRLVKDGILTEYQARKLLTNRPNSLKVDKYIILDRVGSGSMGRVYKAQHQLMGRTVALKVIAPEIATNNRVVSRFQREMRMVGRLDHPNVVRAFDADRVGQLLYIVMEYVPGISLGQRLKTRGLITPGEAAEYAGQASLGLAHAHEQGIVHRDVKPSNLLVTEDHQLKVLDLGLGVLTEADQHTQFATADGIAVGTIDYMSPEQATGRDVDGRSDLFSLGCAMYHLLTGRVPFPGASPMDRLGARIDSRPVPIQELRPEVPTKLAKVLDKLMATRPQDRFQTAAEAADALLSLTRRRPPSATAAQPAMAVRPADPTPPPPPPEPEVIRVEPSYPGWFRPLAGLAEEHPSLALIALLGSAAAAVGLGLILGITLF